VGSAVGSVGLGWRGDARQSKDGERDFNGREEPPNITTSMKNGTRKMGLSKRWGRRFIKRRGGGSADKILG